MTKQYFPTETVFSSYQTCLLPDDENIFSKITIIQFCGFYIFILKTASLIPNINPVTECSIIYIIFCLKVWTSLEFRHIDLFNRTVSINIQKYDKLLI